VALAVVKKSFFSLHVHDDLVAAADFRTLGTFMLERIEHDKDGNLEISVSNVQLFQLEYIAHNRVRMHLHRDDAQDIVIWLSSREKINGSTERI
jgi:hypothetical protein